LGGRSLCGIKRAVAVAIESRKSCRRFRRTGRRLWVKGSQDRPPLAPFELTVRVRVELISRFYQKMTPRGRVGIAPGKSAQDRCALSPVELPVLVRVKLI
jgi:hypothetical protein